MSQSSERKSWLLALSEVVAFDHRSMKALTCSRGMLRDLVWNRGKVMTRMDQDGMHQVATETAPDFEQEVASLRHPPPLKLRRTGATEDREVAENCNRNAKGTVRRF